MASILDAAAALLDEVGVDDFNTNLLATRAGVRVRTVYRYFPNKLAVVVALSERHATWERAFAARELGPQLARIPWRRAFERVLDRYIEGAMGLPGFLAVRRATRAVPELRAVDDRASEQLAEQLARVLRGAGVGLPKARLRAISRTFIEAASAVLDLSYAAPAPRRRELVRELKRMQLAYLATYLER